MKPLLSHIAALCLTSFALTACSNNAHTPEQMPATTATTNDKGYQTYIHAGEHFKQNTFTDIDNQEVKLGDNKKLVILFATWCSDSQRVIKQIQASPLINDTQLQIIAIGREETTQSLTQFAQDYNLEFSLIADPERAIYSQYANKGIPRLILLDEHNKVIKTLIGEDPNTLQQVVW